VHKFKFHRHFGTENYFFVQGRHEPKPFTFPILRLRKLPRRRWKSLTHPCAARPGCVVQLWTRPCWI
jgi:hypothetical protein